MTFVARLLAVLIWLEFNWCAQVSTLLINGGHEPASNFPASLNSTKETEEQRRVEAVNSINKIVPQTPHSERDAHNAETNSEWSTILPRAPAGGSSIPWVNLSSREEDWLPPEEYVRWFPHYLTGHDVEGVPVYVFEIGHWKFKEVLRDPPGGVETAKKIGIKFIEQSINRLLEHGAANNGQGIAVIMDYEGMDLSNWANQHVIEVGMRILSSMSKLDAVINYGWLINVNFFAENFIRLIKPFMGTILDKFEQYGTLKSNWMPMLLRHIPKSDLPPWYGGDDSWRPLWIGGRGSVPEDGVLPLSRNFTAYELV